MSGRAYRIDEPMDVEVRGNWVLASAAPQGEQVALAFSADTAAIFGQRLKDAAQLAVGSRIAPAVTSFAVQLAAAAEQPGELRLFLDDGSCASFPASSEVLRRFSRAMRATEE
jgi:hypothetical protein